MVLIDSNCSLIVAAMFNLTNTTFNSSTTTGAPPKKIGISLNPEHLGSNVTTITSATRVSTMNSTEVKAQLQACLLIIGCEYVDVMNIVLLVKDSTLQTSILVSLFKTDQTTKME
jgi:hypothetical protein